MRMHSGYLLVTGKRMPCGVAFSNRKVLEYVQQSVRRQSFV